MATKQTTYTSSLVNFAINTRYEDLPGDVIQETKRLILDTIGCAIRGIRTDLGRIVIAKSEVIGGDKSESTIWGSNLKSSCVSAAFANAELANAMDADETLINFTHLGASVIPPVLAVGERTAATGREQTIS